MGCIIGATPLYVRSSVLRTVCVLNFLIGANLPPLDRLRTT